MTARLDPCTVLICQNLYVPTEALMVFSHLHHPDGLKNTVLYQAWILETAPNVGMVGRMYILSTRESVRSSWVLALV